MRHSLFGLSAVILSVAVLVHAMSSASAYPGGMEVTGGESPYLSFSDRLNPSGTITIYTVPSDRVLVVTGAMANSNDVHLYESGTIKVNGYSNVMNDGGQNGFLTQGNGTVVFAAGSSVQVANESSSYRYYALQGYLAHP